MNPRGYSAIGLHQPKDRHNIGGVLRSCGIYDVSMLVTTGKRYSRHASDTISTWKHMPFFQNVNDLTSYIHSMFLVLKTVHWAGILFHGAMT